MLKKLFFIVLMVIAIFAIVACKNDILKTDNSDTTDSSTTTETVHSHSYSSATCTEPATCECGVIKGSALGHNYTDATCTTPKTCTRCNAVAAAALGHDYKEATCTSPKICKRCEDVIGEPLGHNFAEATCFLPPTCTICNQTKDSPLGHSYVDNICIRCDEVDPNSLPTPLKNLFVISSYAYDNNEITSSYGETYKNVYHYSKGEYSGKAVYNMKQEYSAFVGSVVAPSGMGNSASLSIYVDDVLMYSLNDITVETPKTDFRIDVKGATKLEIYVKKNNGWRGPGVAIVNAELER